MFRHQKELQFEAKPDRPNPLIAKYLQELIGGQYGEMSVAMQYLFQGWSCRGEEKYKDMLMDIATDQTLGRTVHVQGLFHLHRVITAGLERAGYSFSG